ncbi:hypothetical protein STRIP9103_03881 [Streptomyces ipomoeae 91-03]|uniref:Uncharacterized protein n=1 Tax=Streptomyces ipomoeae 91-03 TaxID=698759 RepID=L1L735_9ACTN|nr:hypothetical protein STRIP9103_03881 [Streptomyces ipomoeae 91-03]
MSHDPADISSFFCDRCDQQIIESGKSTRQERVDSFNSIADRTPFSNTYFIY